MDCPLQWVHISHWVQTSQRGCNSSQSNCAFCLRLGAMIPFQSLPGILTHALLISPWDRVTLRTNCTPLPRSTHASGCFVKNYLGQLFLWLFICYIYTRFLMHTARTRILMRVLFRTSLPGGPYFLYINLKRGKSRAAVS